MRRIIFILISFILWIDCFGANPSDSLYKNEIGTSPLLISTSDNTLNLQPEIKFMTGLYFRRQLSKSINLQISVDYGENTFKDDCDCADHTSGTGTLTELFIKSGARATAFNQLSNKIRPFVQAQAYFTRSRYEIYWSGGFIPSSGFRNSLEQNLGVSLDVGIELRFIPRFPISVWAGQSVAFFTANENKIQWVPLSHPSSTVVAVQLGFEF